MTRKCGQSIKRSSFPLSSYFNHFLPALFHLSFLFLRLLSTRRSLAAVSNRRFQSIAKFSTPPRLRIPKPSTNIVAFVLRVFFAPLIIRSFSIRLAACGHNVSTAVVGSTPRTRPASTGKLVSFLRSVERTSIEGSRQCWISAF